MNSSNSSSVSTDYVSSALLIVFGSVAVFSNMAIIFVLLSNLTLLKKSAFVAGMVAGDLLDGFSLIINGSVKIIRSLDGTASLMVHPSYCMKMFALPSYLIGNQISSIMFLFSGVERFLAVQYYDWYFRKWTNKLAWKLTSLAYIFCIASLVTSVVISLSYDPSTRTPIVCSVPGGTSSNYTAYNYIIAIVSGTVAIMGSLIAMVLFTRRKMKIHSVTNVSGIVKNHLKAQWRLTRITFCLAVADLALVVVPTVLALITSNIGTSIRTWSQSLLCIRSFLNLVIYLLVNYDFRSAALNAIGIEKNTALFDQTAVTRLGEKSMSRF